MSGHEDATRLAALADGELRGAQRRAVERHVAQCPACADAHHAVLELRSQLRSEVPRYHAPEALREAVARTGAVPARPRRWQWLTSGALAGCAATVLAWLAVTAGLDRLGVRDLARQAVAAHVQATLGAHTIDVASSDQHTVKPWLSARLDYSPPVPQLPESGFVLAGARVDRLDGQPVATLVYRYRQHVVDVFVRAQPARPATQALANLRGFNVAHAANAQMDWIAVSDVSAEALLPFVQALAAAGH